MTTETVIDATDLFAELVVEIINLLTGFINEETPSDNKPE